MNNDMKSRFKNDDVKVVRIKRLREDDVLEALLLEEDSVKQNDSLTSFKRRKFMYKRVILDDNNKNLVNENTPTLAKTGSNKFLYEKKQNKRKRADYEEKEETSYIDHIKNYTNETLPTEVNSLLSEFIAKDNLSKNVKNLEAQKLLLKNGKKLRRNHPMEEIVTPIVNNTADLDERYVYDIYIKEEITEENKLAFDKSSIGYLKIVEDGSLVYDECSDAEHQSDDEDSNEEDYYKNDYPEDEDDDRSIIFGDSYDEDDETYYGRRRGSGEFEKGEFDFDNFVSYDEISRNKYMNDNDAYGNTMNKFDNKLQSGNFLDSLNISEDESDDDPSYYYSDNEAESDHEELQGEFNFPRNHFFTTDQDDPMAIYRDKIMNSLEKRIKRNT
ncbi:hypothetical protein QEN19_000685 [Hanseniaspora menglaensis]